VLSLLADSCCDASSTSLVDVGVGSCKQDEENKRDENPLFEFSLLLLFL